jgi:hypothetical protein
MAEDREKISTGPNERAVNEPIAGTAPGLPTRPEPPARSFPSRRATRKWHGSRRSWA